MLNNLKFSKIKYELVLLILALLLFVPPLLRPIGFVASSFVILALASVLYLWDKMEVLVAALLVSPIVKMLEINPLPKWLDMTILLYIVVFGSFLFLFLIKKKHFEKFLVVDLFFIFFTVIVFISYFFTPFEVKEYGFFKLTRFLILYVPIYFLPRLINEEKGYVEITKGLILFGSISGVLLLFFFSTGYDMIHGGVNYLTVAKIVGVVAIFILTEFIRNKKFFPKVILGSLFLLQLFILFRTGSRGGMLSFLVAFSFFSFASYRKHVFKGIIAVLMMVGLIAIFLFNSPRAMERVKLIFSLHKGGSVGDRMTMLSISISLIKERWLTGIGLGGFAKYHYLQYPHNQLVETFLETGIGGFLSLLAVYIVTIIKIVENGIIAIKNKSTYSPFYLSAIFVMTYHMTSFGLEWTRILFFFIGSVVAISNLESKSDIH